MSFPRSQWQYGTSPSAPAQSDSRFRPSSPGREPSSSSSLTHSQQLPTHTNPPPSTAPLSLASHSNESMQQLLSALSNEKSRNVDLVRENLTLKSSNSSLLTELDESSTYLTRVKTELEASENRTDRYREKAHEYRNRAHEAEETNERLRSDAEGMRVHVLQMMEALRTQFIEVLQSWSGQMQQLQESEAHKASQLELLQNQMQQYACQISKAKDSIAHVNSHSILSKAKRREQQQQQHQHDGEDREEKQRHRSQAQRDEETEQVLQAARDKCDRTNQSPVASPPAETHPTHTHTASCSSSNNSSPYSALRHPSARRSTDEEETAAAARQYAKNLIAQAEREAVHSKPYRTTSSPQRQTTASGNEQRVCTCCEGRGCCGSSTTGEFLYSAVAPRGRSLSRGRQHRLNSNSPPHRPVQCIRSGVSGAASARGRSRDRCSSLKRNNGCNHSTSKPRSGSTTARSASRSKSRGASTTRSRSQQSRRRARSSSTGNSSARCRPKSPAEQLSFLQRAHSNYLHTCSSAAKRSALGAHEAALPSNFPERPCSGARSRTPREYAAEAERGAALMGGSCGRGGRDWTRNHSTVQTASSARPIYSYNQRGDILHSSLSYSLKKPAEGSSNGQWRIPSYSLPPERFGLPGKGETKVVDPPTPPQKTVKVQWSKIAGIPTAGIKTKY